MKKDLFYFYIHVFLVDTGTWQLKPKVILILISAKWNFSKKLHVSNSSHKKWSLLSSLYKYVWCISTMLYIKWRMHLLFGMEFITSVIKCVWRELKQDLMHHLNLFQTWGTGRRYQIKVNIKHCLLIDNYLAPQEEKKKKKEC